MAVLVALMLFSTKFAILNLRQRDSRSMWSIVIPEIFINSAIVILGGPDTVFVSCLKDMWLLLHSLKARTFLTQLSCWWWVMLYHQHKWLDNKMLQDILVGQWWKEWIKEAPRRIPVEHRLLLTIGQMLQSKLNPAMFVYVFSSCQ